MAKPKYLASEIVARYLANPNIPLTYREIQEIGAKPEYADIMKQVVANPVQKAVITQNEPGGINTNTGSNPYVGLPGTDPRTPTVVRDTTLNNPNVYTNTNTTPNRKPDGTPYTPPPTPPITAGGQSPNPGLPAVQNGIPTDPEDAALFQAVGPQNYAMMRASGNLPSQMKSRKADIHTQIDKIMKDNNLTPEGMAKAVQERLSQNLNMVARQPYDQMQQQAMNAGNSALEQRGLYRSGSAPELAQNVAGQIAQGRANATAGAYAGSQSLGDQLRGLATSLGQFGVATDQARTSSDLGNVGSQIGQIAGQNFQQYVQNPFQEKLQNQNIDFNKWLTDTTQKYNLNYANATTPRQSSPDVFTQFLSTIPGIGAAANVAYNALKRPQS